MNGSESYSSDFRYSFDISVHSSIKLHFKDSPIQMLSLPVTTLSCFSDSQCQCDEKNTFMLQRCVDYVVSTTATNSHEHNMSMLLHYACSNDILNSVCLNLYVTDDDALYLNGVNSEKQAHVQELQVLSDSAYAVASNSCENAVVPDRHCHWIPFSTVTHSKCNDCPPICRAREQTLNFVQFLVGMTLLIASFHITFVPLMAVSTNYAPVINGSKVIYVTLETMLLCS